jgi:hypothetical protein
MKKLFLFLAAALTFAITSFAQIGSLSSDLVFTPVTPCRLFDTRTSFGGTGPIAAGGTKDFAVWGVSSFSAQGGAASNCGIVAGAYTASVAVNMTVVLPVTAGFITAYPTGVARPLAAALNFSAGDVRGNMVIVKIAQTGATNLSVYSTSTTELVGDVVGYYSKPVATALECMETTQTQVTILAGAINAAIAPGCPVGYTSVVILCDASSFDLPLRTGGTGDGCASKNNTAISQTIFASRRCCRIPGR